MDTILLLALTLGLGAPDHATRATAHATLAKHVPAANAWLAWGRKCGNPEVAERCALLLTGPRPHVPAPPGPTGPLSVPCIDLLPDEVFKDWGAGFDYDRKVFMDRAKKEFQGPHGAPYYLELRYASLLFGETLQRDGWVDGPSGRCEGAAREALELEQVGKWFCGE